MEGKEEKKKSPGRPNTHQLTPENLGAKIANAREELGIPRYRLAEMIGMPEHTLRRVESGESLPSFDTLYKIVEGLNKKVILK